MTADLAAPSSRDGRGRERGGLGGGQGGHPEVDFPALRVRQEDSDLSAEWSWVLNDRRAPVWHRHESQALTDVKQLGML